MMQRTLPAGIRDARGPVAPGVALADGDALTGESPKPSLRERVWVIVDGVPDENPSSHRFETFVLTLIALNVTAVVLQSVRDIEVRYARPFHLFELFSVAVFSAEYLARIWSCTVDPRFHHPVRGRMRFMLRPLAVIDLLSILPFFVSLATVDLRVLRAARLFRLVRLLKAGEYIAALALLRRVLRDKREELVMAGALMSILLVIASSVMYFAENGAQPDRFSSIPQSMWWAVATLTTVGYGDVYPVTPLGRLAAACISVLGIGFFALPTAILGSGFAEAMKAAKPPERCPHCGGHVERA
jgi:voltage-gated potassium channel